MEKVLKKVFLLLILMFNLVKQLILGLICFIVNRVQNPVGAVVGSLLVGVLLVSLLTMLFGNTDSKNVDSFAGSTASAVNNTAVTVTGVPVNRVSTEVNVPSEKTAAKKEDLTAKLDGFLMQATDVEMSVGRGEPFAPCIRFPGAEGEGDLPIVPNLAKLSPAELAKQQAEQRQNEIKYSLQNDITVKGIVLDITKKKPMAILDVLNPDGSKFTKTVRPGEEVQLANCVAKVEQIGKKSIIIKSDKVALTRHLPEFNDNNVGMAPGSSGTASAGVPASSSSGELTGYSRGPASRGSSVSFGSGPSPDEVSEALANDRVIPDSGRSGSGGSSTINDAKKKIEEIDKLLTSF